MGNGFYLIKFSNVMDRNIVLHGLCGRTNFLPPSLEKEL